jgi:hypothetical protein
LLLTFERLGFSDSVNAASDDDVPPETCGFKPGVFYLTRTAFNALNSEEMVELTTAPAFVIVDTDLEEYPFTVEEVQRVTGSDPSSLLQYHSEFLCS